MCCCKEGETNQWWDPRVLHQAGREVVGRRCNAPPPGARSPIHGPDPPPPDARMHSTARPSRPRRAPVLVLTSARLRAALAGYSMAAYRSHRSSTTTSRSRMQEELEASMARQKRSDCGRLGARGKRSCGRARQGEESSNGGGGCRRPDGGLGRWRMARHAQEMMSIVHSEAALQPRCAGTSPRCAPQPAVALPSPEPPSPPLPLPHPGSACSTAAPLPRRCGRAGAGCRARRRSAQGGAAAGRERASAAGEDGAAGRRAGMRRRVPGSQQGELREPGGPGQLAIHTCAGTGRQRPGTAPLPSGPAGGLRNPHAVAPRHVLPMPMPRPPAAARCCTGSPASGSAPS